MMVKVLQAFIADDSGGLTKYILRNYYKIDRSQVQFDFLTYEKQELACEKHIISLGGRVFHIPRPANIIGCYRALKVIFRSYDYDIMHIHLSYANVVVLILLRYIFSGKVLIHSHSTAIDSNNFLIRCIKRGIHIIGRALISCLADYYLTCSKTAGNWMYPEAIRKSDKYVLFRNAISLKKYQYSPEIRAQVRRKLNINDDCKIIGHVGRLSYQKNQEFLLRVFAQLKVKHDARLMLVGDGPDSSSLEHLAKELGVEDYVWFMGRRSDVSELMQAMDGFILTSRFEGFVLVGVEAQAMGLPCLFSVEMSEEIKLTDGVRFLSLNDSVARWAEDLWGLVQQKRGNTEQQLRQAGFDIDSEVKRLARLYKHVGGSEAKYVSAT